MKRAVLLAAAVALLTLSTAAQANMLSPGATVAPDHRSVSGHILADTGFLSYTLTDSAGNTVGTGNWEAQVIADALNPFGAGRLSFVYQIRDVTTGTIGQVSVTDFATVLVDASQFTGQPPLGAGTVAALNATRSTIAADGGATVAFNFVPSMTRGQTSLARIVSTNVTKFVAGDIKLSDGNGGVSTMPGFAPQPIPEPPSLVLLGVGLALGLGGAGLRRWPQSKAVTA
jgi:hypothetical protein